MGGLLWSTRVSLRAAHGGPLKQNSSYNGGLLYYAFPYYNFRCFRFCELTSKGCINLDHASLLFPLVNSHLSLSRNSWIALSRTVAARLVPGTLPLPNYMTVVVAPKALN